MEARGRDNLRYGFTTGTAATAAAVAAVRWILGKPCRTVTVELPDGRRLPLSVAGVHSLEKENGEGAEAWVIKDGGDDPDVTSGLAIVASVRLLDEERIEIRGGEGVGVVTKKGLSVPVGEPAINPGPRAMLVQNLAAELGPGRGAVVTISVPEGRTVATRTYNPRLGVEGGISILGTRGIVVPMSEEALVATIFAELDVLAASGRTACCLVPGNYGEATARKLGVPADALVKTSNFLGYSLEKLSRIGEAGKGGRIDHLLLVGQVGKLLKVAGGSLHTSSRYSDGRLETLASCAVLAGASREEVAAILEANTADEAVNALLEKPWAAEALDRVGRRIVAVLERSCKILRCVGVVLFILPDRIVYTSGEVARLLAALRQDAPAEPPPEKPPERAPCAGATAAKKPTKPGDDARRPCATETDENTEEETKG
jgi:cobalt-precorrin-5B (C1)-methyltransferase